MTRFLAIFVLLSVTARAGEINAFLLGLGKELMILRADMIEADLHVVPVAYRHHSLSHTPEE